ncbi:Alpha/Beta hydrolase protein [Pavlovales sp. CCMP2436]|nr:Alpha/Beta hydrolase protein [Pavlovales sp. CCMP2436]|mmetsp:Transcript_21159/g.53599  ORF Transcript_21159/g.53599 Transcript_21159/m.53599 type:complete len:315 (+) Transcript_21159:80-1024(+)
MPDVADVAAMSVKELRAYIASAGLGFADCFEISDLRERANEAAARHTSGTPVVSSPGTPARGGAVEKEKRTFFGYDCTLMSTKAVLAGEAMPGLIVILLHGLGANASDFASIPPMLDLDSATGSQTLWVFPQAPVGSMFVAAWWTIDVMRWMGAMSAGEVAIAKLIRDVPPGLPECRARLTKLVAEVCLSANDCPTSRVVLGGFSQGAMTSVDVALSMPPDKRVGGILSLSGAPIVVDEWAGKLQKMKGISVMLTHGRSDGTIPFAVCGWLEELLKHNGAVVTTSHHGGGHDFGPQTTIAAVRDYLVARAKAAA